MNCDALSISGEKAIIATSIHLLRQIINDNTGTFDTTLENIDAIYLHTKSLLATFDETSNQPVSASAIATWIAAILNNYRRSDVLIQMSEVDNLLVFFKQLQIAYESEFLSHRNRFIAVQGKWY